MMEQIEETRILVANIAAMLQARGWTPADLVRRAGINQSAYHDIAAGRVRSPRLETLAKIARGLDVSLADLFLDPAEAAKRRAILAAFDALPPEDQRRLLAMAEALRGTA